MKNKSTKKGSVIGICLVFATVLLVMGLGYSKMTSTAKKQTVQIDDRIKLEYLANGITEIALLKYQLYPADFYACVEASKLDNHDYLNAFTIEADEFSQKFVKDKSSYSSYNDDTVSLYLASMTILTNKKWNKEILFIQANGSIDKVKSAPVNKEVTRLVEIDRITKGFE